MEKYIYKITNIINNKVYIGQSKNPTNRWKEHRRLGLTNMITRKNKNAPLYNAIKKYGIENFIFEVIEDKTKDYNDKEKYWIFYYKSNCREYGYNILQGGQDPPILSGDDSFLCKYSDEIILKIQHDLLNNVKTNTEIRDEYNISEEYLSMINRGIARKNDKLFYPLRCNGNEVISKKLVDIITNDLMYSYLSIEEIQRKNNVDSNTIYSINQGKHKHCKKNIKYPIREKYHKMSNVIIGLIYEDLKHSNLKFSEIQEKYGIPKVSLSRINQGKKYRQDGVDYPIRPSFKRVYK